MCELPVLVYMSSWKRVESQYNQELMPDLNANENRCLNCLPPENYAFKISCLFNVFLIISY